MATTNSKDDPKAKLSRYQEMRDFSRTADRRGGVWPGRWRPQRLKGAVRTPREAPTPGRSVRSEERREPSRVSGRRSRNRIASLRIRFLSREIFACPNAN